MYFCARITKRFVYLHRIFQLTCMKYIIYPIYLFIFLLFSLKSMANVNVQSFFLSSSNGLKADYIRGIAQDPRGYIWMAATTGLIRYDGYTTELIVPDESERRKLMLDERTQTLDLWLDRFVWLRLQGQKYSCYDTQTDSFVDYTGNGSYSDSYRSYYILGNGELWLNDDKNGCKVIRFDGKNFTSEKLPSDRLPKEAKLTLPKTHAGLLTSGRQLIKDNRGNLVVVSVEGELWYIDQKSQAIFHITGIYNKELQRLNGSPRYSVVTDKDGFIWISTYGNGLFVYNPKTCETTHFINSGNNVSPIQTNYLLKLYEDKAGNIWACQENMGVAVIKRQDINVSSIYFTSAERLDHTNSIHLLARVNQSIYVGNRYNGLKKADDLLNGLTEIPNIADDVVALCADRQGIVWSGTRDNGIYVSKQNFRHNPDDPKSLSAGKISDIVCDTKGRIWISNFDAGVDLAIPDEKGGYTFQHFFSGENAITHPRKMLVDHKGHIWLCSDEGLFTFSPDKLIADKTAYKHQDADVSQQKMGAYFSLIENKSNHIFVGTSGTGIMEFDNSRSGETKFIRSYTKKDGMPDNSVHSLIEDDKGDIWTGTDHGVARFSPKTGKIMSLMPGNTLQGNMFIENAVCKLADGRLAFGSRHGIIVVNPKTVVAEKPLFSLRVTDVEVNGVSIREMEDGNLIAMFTGNEGIRLNHNENSLTFRFSDFEYNEGLTSKYTYRLKGYDKEWSPMTTYNFASYKNLPPGDYILEVKSQNSNGEWNESVVRMPVTILPPMWQTWWAYIIYVVILGVIVFFAYRSAKRMNALRNRIKVEQQLTEFKMQFFTNISHEFRTPLTIIRGAADHMKLSDKVPADMKQPVSSIGKSVNRLMRLINQLMEFSKMHEGKLKLSVTETEVVAFLREIYGTFANLAEGKHIDYQFSTNVKSYLAPIDREKLDKIAYNLISNAFKYTPSQGSVKVSLRIDGTQLVITVTDTGVGIPKDKQQELFTRFNQSTFAKDSIGIGLHLTNELVRIHHGAIAYNENSGGGSIFTVTLPTDKSIYSPEEFMTEGNNLLSNESSVNQTYDYKEVSGVPMNDLRVLIVDDDYDVREYLCNELQHFFQCDGACDGDEALIKIQENRPDLIISDVMMPGMNGYELTKKLRSDQTTSDIPIILLTALSSEEKHAKGLSSGADAYIAKPFSMQLLIARCTQLLEQRNQLKLNYAKEVISKPETPAIIVEEQDRKLRAQLDNWILQHLKDSNLNIDLFAEKMGYGRTTFYKKVKKLTGKTPNDYIKTLRMERAVELLKDDTLTVAQVSYDIGIEDPYYFSKTFKAFYGISPTQYRKGEKPSQG